ncbi:MAG: hypothetical protein ACLRMZ_20065 [Blautia marasmi]
MDKEAVLPALSVTELLSKAEAAGETPEVIEDKDNEVTLLDYSVDIAMRKDDAFGVVLFSMSDGEAGSFGSQLRSPSTKLLTATKTLSKDFAPKSP